MKWRNGIVVYKKQLNDMQKLVLYFVIYSFLGWILETIFALFVLGKFVKRGFLYGPVCPIYGFGAVLIILTLKKFKGKKTEEFFIVLATWFLYTAGSGNKTCWENMPTTKMQTEIRRKIT